MRVALVEMKEWASGTSSRSSRLIHGGIRYLEHGDIALVRESVREREILVRIAPGLVKPLEFTWPVYRGARLSRWKLRLGLSVYDWLAGKRRGRRHHSLSRDEVKTLEPSLRDDRHCAMIISSAERATSMLQPTMPASLAQTSGTLRSTAPSLSILQKSNRLPSLQAE
jgi:glycerol-3-phosphate dehydrogenase